MEAMESFLITLSILASIFFVVSIIVLLRRQQKAQQSVGYVINATGPVTHRQIGRAPDTVYPPSAYQTHVYPSTIVYPARTVSRVQVQVIPTETNGTPVSVHNGTVNKTELSILPANYMNPVTQQTHHGAVETVSQI